MVPFERAVSEQVAQEHGLVTRPETHSPKHIKRCKLVSVVKMFLIDQNCTVADSRVMSVVAIAVEDVGQSNDAGPLRHSHK